MNSFASSHEQVGTVRTYLNVMGTSCKFVHNVDFMWLSMYAKTADTTSTDFISFPFTAFKYPGTYKNIYHRKRNRFITYIFVYAKKRQYHQLITRMSLPRSKKRELLSNHLETKNEHTARLCIIDYFSITKRPKNRKRVRWRGTVNP